MVISRYVPLQISRKRFSDFLECQKLENTNDLFLVGYQDKGGVKQNKKLKFQDVKQYIDSYQDKISNASDKVKNQINLQLNKLWKQVNDLKGVTDDQLPEVPQLNAVMFRRAIYSDADKCSIINLKNTLGCVEINGYQGYNEDYLIFDNPIIGVVTRIVVDNSGIKNTNNQYIPPTKNFTLYYGRNDYLQDGTPCFEQIAEVEPYYTAVVEILHTNKTDIIINVNYTPTMFVKDVQVQDQYIDDGVEFHDVSPEDNQNEFYDIDMENDRAYMEFECGIHTTYTFWFKNPELGSMTYLVISNPTTDLKSIVYGKIVAKQDGSEQYKTEMILKDLAPGERAVVEVFHSLSSDIISKVTTVNM